MTSIADYNDSWFGDSVIGAELLQRVFPGESQMASRLRDFDWTTNQLGSPEQWPQSLQSAVGLCLAARLPMQVWWGPELTLLYNDASIRFFGTLHPGVLAHSGRGWAIDTLGPAVEEAVASGNASWSQDVRVLLAGAETFVSFSVTPIMGDDGRVAGVFSTLVDTTESAIAKRRLDTLHALSVATSTAGSLEAGSVAIIDVLRRSSDIAFAVLQLADGPTVMAGCDAVPAGVHEAAAAVIETDAILEIAVDHRAAKQAFALPIHDGDGVVGVLVCGVSPYVAFDAPYHTFLELVAARIAVSLADVRSPGEGARVQAQASVPATGRSKDAFLSVLAHELRNPLSALMTTVQTLMLRSPSLEVELMERSVRHLSRVVDNLLDVSRIARGKLELQPKRIELAQVVDRALELANPIVTDRKNQVFVRVPRLGLRLSVDPERIAQVIANLLNNATKYSEPGSRIWLEGSRVDDRVRLAIKDEGTGIERDRIGSVFEAFYQPPETRPRTSGLGLGLAISRSVAELHGGTLAVHSEGAGHGTECVLELPFDPRPSSRPTLPAATPPVRKRLLLVEDNDDTARALKNALEQIGYVVAVAHDAPIALNLARTFEPDVALLDIGLPVMDGWELARRLREQRAATHELFFVAVTAYDQESDKRKSHEAGFAEHLIKPIDLGKLEQVVESLPGRNDEVR